MFALHVGGYYVKLSKVNKVYVYLLQNSSKYRFKSSVVYMKHIFGISARKKAYELNVSMCACWRVRI